MAKVTVGDVIQVRSGLHLLNTVDNSIEISRDNLIGIVEVTRGCPIGSEDDHFEHCAMIDMRLLGADGSYDPNSAVLTFALEGDFRPEFIDTDPKVLRHLTRAYV